MAKYKNTFEPLQIGSCTIKNRLILGPVSVPTYDMTDNLTPDGVEFIVERAKGGFGLIIQTAAWADTEVESMAPGAIMFPLKNPGIFLNRASVLTERVHNYGAKIFCQITVGLGRNAGMKAPSVLPSYFMPDMMTEALTVEEIKKKIECVVQTAVLMKQAGYDGVEIHALHWGYLVDEFAMSIFNQRTDEYGGSLENRLRICKELVEGIKTACGADFPVTIKLGLKSYIQGFHQTSLDGSNEAGRTLEEAIEIAKLLEVYGYDAVHCNAGIYDSFWKAIPTSYEPKGAIMELARELKKHVNIPVLVCGRMNDPELIETVLSNGEADAAVLSRGGIADPYFAIKMMAGQPEEIRPCLSCSVGCNARGMAGLPPSCMVNPEAGREATYKLQPALVKKNITVVGGGAAGMEAARVAALRGHNVTVYEKADTLGGHLIHTGQHEFKAEIMQLSNWFALQLKNLGVPVKLNTEVTADMLRELKPDVVFMANGSEAVMPAWLPGIDHAKTVSCIDAVMDEAALGDKVVIVGGGLTGCELAYDLARHGKKVTVVEMANDILTTGPAMPMANEMHLRLLLADTGVELMTGTKIAAVTDEGAVVETADGSKVTLPADNVVLAMGLKPCAALAKEISGEGIAVFEIGDERQPVNIMSAIWDGHEVAMNI